MIFLTSLVLLLAQHVVNAIPQAALASILTPLSSASANSSMPSSDSGVAEDFLGQRTLLDIIWSCFVTIFACTWVIVHPNVPSESDSEWTVVGRRLKIMLYTLLVPELVLYWASKQWYAAREVSRKHAARGWTKTHGFFIGMGGFVLYKDGKAIRPLDITDLEELFELAEVEWPTVSEEDIMDKSKGDYFTKSVVLIQTTWFIIQCIARGALGLGLTELELVALAFAALSGAMYFFWWFKPLDVKRPIPLHANQTATMKFSGQPDEKEAPGESEIHLSIGEDAGSTAINSRGSICRTSHLSLGRDSSLRRTRSFSSLGAPYDSSFKLNGHVDANSIRVVTSSSSSTSISLVTHSNVSDPIYHSYLSHRCWVYSRTVVPPHTPYKKAAKKRSISDIFTRPIRTFIDDLQELRHSGEILSGRGECRVSTFYAAMHLKLQHELTILFLATATVYGGIHCTAWRFVFPSIVEKWLWRSSALAVSILPSLFGLQWVIMVKLTARPYNPSTSRLTERVENIFHITSIPRLLVMLAVYTVAHIALLVLPLLALRSLSPDAYISVSWTNVVPHV